MKDLVVGRGCHTNSDKPAAPVIPLTFQRFPA